MYPHQRERLSEVLEREQLDALVATTAANVFYVTGFRSLTEAVFHTPHFAVFTGRGTALVVPAVDVAPIVADGVGVDHVHTFGGFVAQFSEASGAETARILEIAERRVPSAADALAAALDALGVRQGRVGLDEGALSHPVWARLTTRLAETTIVPAAAHLLAARRVKSPYEIECLERALTITEEAVNAVLELLKPGVTEREALAAYEAEVVKRGGATYPGVIAIGERSWIAAPVPTERPLRSGDVVRLDVGAIVKGYWASLARTAVMGAPTARQQAAWDAIQTGLEAAIDAIRPGAPAARVHQVAVETVRAAGFPDYHRYHVGHGVGLEPYERPKLADGIATPLELGEILRVEVPYLEVGWAGLALRDTVLVTRVGTRTMNHSVHGLIALD